MNKRYDHIKEIDQLQEVEKFNPYHGKDGRFSNATSPGAFAPLFGRTERGQALLNQYKEKHGDKGGAAAAPSKPAEEKKPAEYKKISDKEAVDMADKMGELGEDDFSQVLSLRNGYFHTGNSFDINEKLREGKADQLPEESRKTIEAMDRNMKPSPEDIQLTRMAGNDFLDSLGLSGVNGNDEDALGRIQSLAGSVYSNPGYTSTSYTDDGGFFGSRPVKMNISAPKGTKMLMSPLRNSRGGVEEHEIVLARNTAIKITAVRGRKDKWGYYDGIEMDCEVISLD